MLHSRRFLVVASAVLLGVSGVHSQNTSDPGRITVSQGTSMAAAVSPDGTSIVIDLQGALWILPIAGGKATRITDTLHDARQPAWAPGRAWWRTPRTNTAAEWSTPQS
jgi:hypothetical protein